MKKNLLTLALLFAFSFVTFAQGQTNAFGNGFHFDITTLLIGLVIGGVIGYMVGSRKSSN